MEALFGLFAVLGILFVATALRGFVLATLWGWFVVPVFQVPPVSVAKACGLALVVTLLTQGVSKKDEDPVAAFQRAAVSAFIFPLFVLLIGRVIVGFL